MNTITDFSKLLAAVTALGVDPKDCLLELEEGIEISSAAEFVSAPNGFYDVLATGHIVRVLIHLAAGDHARCHRDPWKWHRYHVAPCTASVQPDRRNRSFKTRRKDGRFTYYLHDSWGDEYRQQDRVAGRGLKICGFCRKKLINLGLGEEEGDPDLPRLLEGSLPQRLHHQSFRYDLDGISGFSQEDWVAIVRFVKARFAGFCAQCGGDFSKHSQHLQAHYVEASTLPGVLGRVKVLCVGCHALQKGHERLRLSPELAEFRRLRPEHRIFAGG